MMCLMKSLVYGLIWKMGRTDLRGVIIYTRRGMCCETR